MTEFAAISIVVFIVASAIAGLWCLAQARDEIRDAVQEEAKLIHRRIDDLTGEMQLLQAIRPAVYKNGAVKDRQPIARVYDYESSQRATLEEFKEQ